MAAAAPVFLCVELGWWGSKVGFYVGFAGMLLCMWAIANSFGASFTERTRIFVGPLGRVFNIFVLLLGGAIMFFGLVLSLA